MYIQDSDWDEIVGDCLDFLDHIEKSRTVSIGAINSFLHHIINQESSHPILELLKQSNIPVDQATIFYEKNGLFMSWKDISHLHGIAIPILRSIDQKVRKRLQGTVCLPKHILKQIQNKD